LAFLFGKRSNIGIKDIESEADAVETTIEASDETNK
jgi:hypothetical protein